jgi:hypothetical protein
MRWYLLLGAAGVLAGCQRPAGRTADQFQFLQAGMAITEITNRVGLPDRQSGSGQESWAYNLSDGSSIIITLMVMPDYMGQLSLHERLRNDLSPKAKQYTDPNKMPDFRVAYFSQYRGTNRLWTKPADYK